MKSLITRFQIYLMLRRANKLIRIESSKDGSTIVDWSEKSDEIPTWILVSVLIGVILLANFAYYLVKS